MIKYLLDKKLNENKYSSINEEKHVIKEFLKDKKVEKIKLESLNFKSIYELKGYNRNHDFILINSELFKLINEKEEKENEVTYVLKDEKKMELFINDESYPFFRFGNFIYSFINFNLYLLIKIYLFQNEIFKTKKSAYIYIFKKEFIQKYKDNFEYEKLESIIKERIQNNKMDDKQINDFIENIPEFYTNSLKEKLVDKVNLFPLDENNIEIKEIKSNEDIIFNYIQEFDKIILDGYSIINFCKINEIVDNRKIIIRVGLFFIKDKVLIIFKNKEKNKVYGQLGMINELNNNYIFLVDYLISIKKYKAEKKDTSINILDDFLKDEKNIDNFYQGIYGEKSKISFEYKISEEIILYILNLKVNNENYVSQIEYGNNEYLNLFNNNNVVNNNKNEKGIIEKNNDDNKDDKMEEEINYYLQDNNAAKNNQENEKNIMNENNPNDNNIQSNYQNNPFFKIPEQNINENYNDINYLNNNQNYQNNNLAEYNINEKNHQKQNKIGENNNQYEYNNNETKLFLEKSNSFDNLNGLNNYAQQNTNYNNLNNNTNFNNINNNPINININISQNIPIDINFNNNINNNNSLNSNSFNDINKFNIMNNYNNEINNNMNKNYAVPQKLDIQPIKQQFYDINKIKQYLCLIISFIQSDQIIKNNINIKYFESPNKKTFLYLINKKWVNNLLSLLNPNSELNNVIYSDLTSFDINILVDNIIAMLTENAKQYYNNLDYNNIMIQLKDYSLSKIDEQYININGINSHIYYNFYFLEENFYNFLRNNFNINLDNYSIKSESILINQKIFAFINKDSNVYIGKIGTDYSFFTENIIYCNNNTKNEIINLIQNNDFSFFNYMLLSGDLIQNNHNIPIINLISQQSIKNNNIIDKLKAYLQIEIYKNQLVEETNEFNQNYKSNEQEVVLVTKDFLNTIGYN